MSSSIPSQNQTPLEADQPEKLMVHGLVYLKQGDGAPVEVVRGTPVLTEEGWEVGKLAAVRVDRHQRVTHLVLGLPRTALDYRLAPVELVQRVDEEGISLRLSSQAVESLPPRRPEEKDD